MFQYKDNYTYELDNMWIGIRMPWDHRPIKLAYFDEFIGKTYCLIQRVNAGYRPDDWDNTHDCVRGEIVTRIVDLQQTELSNQTMSAFNNDLGCFLRLQDPEGNAYEALRVSKSTNLKYRAPK